RPRDGRGGLHAAADPRDDPDPGAVPLAGSASGGPPVSAVSMTAGASIEPAGPKPRRLTPGRVGIYAFLIIAALFFLIPLYAMIITSMKSMEEFRTGNIFARPLQPTMDYWIKAWTQACTGTDC